MLAPSVSTTGSALHIYLTRITYFSTPKIYLGHLDVATVDACAATVSTATLLPSHNDPLVLRYGTSPSAPERVASMYS